MIADILENAEMYYSIHPGFARVFEFIKEFIKNPVDGSHIIDGDNIYAGVISYSTAPMNDAKWETHDKYIDLHFLIEGEEVIWWKSRKGLVPITEYNIKDDYTFYSYDSVGTPILINNLSFVILFPDDAHIPSQMYNSPSSNRKMIIKIRL